MGHTASFNCNPTLNRNRKPFLLASRIIRLHVAQNLQHESFSWWPKATNQFSPVSQTRPDLECCICFASNEVALQLVIQIIKLLYVVLNDFLGNGALIVG
jgi:hypothetical protein